MTTPALAALFLLSQSSQAPIDRAATFLKGTVNLAISYEESDTRSKGTRQCTFEWHWPGHQRWTAKDLADSVEFRQAPQGTIAVFHKDEQYEEFFPESRLASPPSWISYSLAYPGFLLSLHDPSGKQPAWKVKAASLVDGAKTTEAYFTTGNNDNGYELHLWVDSVGRILQAHIRIVQMGRPTDADLIHLSYRVGDLGQSRITNDLPLGYSPRVLPNLRMTRFAGDLAAWGTWKKASGSTEDMAASRKGKKTAVLFTSADCDPSHAAEPVWRKLRTALGAERADLIEVRLDSAKSAGQATDPSRPVFLDDDGKIEKAWGPLYTPYIFMVGADGKVIGGWAGYAPDQDEQLIKTVVGAFKEE